MSINKNCLTCVNKHPIALRFYKNAHLLCMICIETINFKTVINQKKNCYKYREIVFFFIVLKQSKVFFFYQLWRYFHQVPVDVYQTFWSLQQPLCYLPVKTTNISPYKSLHDTVINRVNLQHN